MTRPKNDEDRLRYLVDAIEESFLSASDDEIVDDIRLQGRDPEAAADAVRQLIQAQIKVERQKALHAAKQGLRIASLSRHRNSPIPSDTGQRRGLVDRIMSGRAAIPMEITLAFREGKGMSDEDVAGLLEDLAELGLINDDNDK